MYQFVDDIDDWELVYRHSGLMNDFLTYSTCSADLLTIALTHVPGYPLDSENDKTDMIIFAAVEILESS